ncbi:MAG: hypothetical protein EA370_07305 [Wenzhouxiangella sp.]|nr:MAG: hypothetical protein EA370_07305 [Wenzhouxiangella sp.]
MSGENAWARSAGPIHYGFICPAHTPDFAGTDRRFAWVNWSN